MNGRDHFFLGSILLLCALLMACSASEEEMANAQSVAPKIVSLKSPMSPCKQMTNDLNQQSLLNKKETLSLQMKEALSQYNRSIDVSKAVFQFLPLTDMTNSASKPTTLVRLYINDLPLWPHAAIWHKGDRKWLSLSGDWLSKADFAQVNPHQLQKNQLEALARKASSEISDQMNYLDGCAVYGFAEESATKEDAARESWALSPQWLVNFARGGEGVSVVLDDHSATVIKITPLQIN